VKPAGDERTSDGGDLAAQRPPLEQLMDVRSVDRDGTVLLVVEGAVDGLTAPRLRTALAAAFDRLAGRALVLDLSEVTFLGSPGLRVLFDCAVEAAHHRGHQPLRVVVDHARPVVRPIEIVGLDNVLALYHRVDEAMRGDEPTA
jgi:anti-sigma B factor antagonist